MYSYFHKCKHPRTKGEISHLIFWVLKWLAPFGAKILSLLINPRHLAPKYLEHFIGSAPPLFILDPLLWIESAYVSLYINSCFGLNKALTNLTSLRQRHLQYIPPSLSLSLSLFLSLSDQSEGERVACTHKQNVKNCLHRNFITIGVTQWNSLWCN